MDELRELILIADAEDRRQMVGWLARHGQVSMLRLAAHLGDEDARERLGRRLAMLRERAAAGSKAAREELARWPDGLAG